MKNLKKRLILALFWCCNPIFLSPEVSAAGEEGEDGFFGI